MREDILFIPMIARALAQPDPSTSLRETFTRIEAMGQTPEGQRCYRQFLMFMSQVQQAMPAKAMDNGELPPSPAERPIRIMLERQDEQVGVFTFADNTGVDIVAGIGPGDYHLITDTGWLLWEGHLSADDLLWSTAFPGQPLSMAADTESAALQPTRQVDLLDGSMILRTYAGPEAGVLEVQILRRGTEDHGR